MNKSISPVDKKVMPTGLCYSVILKSGMRLPCCIPYPNRLRNIALSAELGQILPGNNRGIAEIFLKHLNGKPFGIGLRRAEKIALWYRRARA